MSSNVRPQTNVGVGTLRETDEKEYTINEGWDFYQRNVPDDSVFDREPFDYDCTNINQNGPVRVEIPSYPGKFLNPASLRLNGTCRLIYKEKGVKKNTLPVNATVIGRADGKQLPELEFVAKTEPQKTTLKTKTAKELIDNEKLYPVVTGVQLLRAAADNSVSGVTLTTDYAKIVMAPQAESKQYPFVAPENLMCQSLFNDVQIFMNSVQVTKNANLEYAHKAYFETLLTYSDEAFKTHMQGEMWNPDDDLEIAAKDTGNDGTNKKFQDKYGETASFQRKAKKYCANEDFQFSMQLHTELSSINSYLPDNIRYEFVFHPNQPSLYLRGATGLQTAMDTAGGKYEIFFSKLSLSGEFMIPSPTVLGQIERFFKSNDAIFRTVRTEILKNQINARLQHFDWTNIFSASTLPDQIFMAMVAQDAKDGSIEKDPFYFGHYDVSHVRMSINNRNYPVTTLTPDFEKNNYMIAYKNLYDNMAIKNANCGLTITPNSFKYGNTIFAWDLNKDGCGGAHGNHSELHGNASLHLLFKKPLPENVCVLICGIYRDYMLLDQWRKPKVITGYGIAEMFAALAAKRKSAASI